jgi:hypothetical protein
VPSGMALETCELEALSVRSVSVLSEEDAEVATQVARHLLRRLREAANLPKSANSQMQLWLAGRCAFHVWKQRVRAAWAW